MNRATRGGAWLKGMLPTRGVFLAALIVLGTTLAISALMMTTGSLPLTAQEKTQPRSARLDNEEFAAFLRRQS